jgi:hypothetical protein
LKDQAGQYGGHDGGDSRAVVCPLVARTLFHPEHGQMRLDDMLALYSWHGRHHVAHVTTLREKGGWR